MPNMGILFDEEVGFEQFNEVPGAPVVKVQCRQACAVTKVEHKVAPAIRRSVPLEAYHIAGLYLDSRRFGLRLGCYISKCRDV